jgi:hypothetical protein
MELDFLEALQSHFTCIAAGLSILKTVKIAKIAVDLDPLIILAFFSVCAWLAEVVVQNHQSILLLL